MKIQYAVLELDNFLNKMRMHAIDDNKTVGDYLQNATPDDLRYKLLLALKLMNDVVTAEDAHLLYSLNSSPRPLDKRTIP